MDVTGVPAAEDRLLGGLIDGLATDPGAVVPVLGVLRPEHFGRASNRAVLAAVAALHRLGRPVDLVTINQYLREPGPAHQAAWAADLAWLWEVRCHPGEAGELAGLLARGIGRCPATTTQPPPPTDPPPGGGAWVGEGDTSFAFGANAPDAEGGGTEG